MYKLNYKDITDNYSETIKYCLRFSDSFSVITNMKKPYEKKIYPESQVGLFANWEKYLEKQVTGIKEWPGTKTNEKRKVMNVYNSRKFRTDFKELPNLFLPKENDLPEDVCFYRGEDPWLVTVSHEKIAYMNFVSEKDQEFLSQKNIRYYIM